MTRPPFLRSRLVLLAALVIGAGAVVSTAQPPKGATPAERAFLDANDRAMNAMMAGMAVKPTGDVDRDFALMMIPHHQGAIDMCRPLLKHGRDPRLKTLCRSIITNQTSEIALMRRILGPGAPAPAASMARMDMSGHGM